MIEDILKEADTKMDKSVESTREEFAAIRAGRANPQMFSKLTADYYGTPTPIQQLASFTAPEARVILIAPFEVGFLAYVNVTGHVDLFAGMLFYFGLFLFVLLSWRVFRRPVPFAASWWAISFPMAALSNAALKYADHVQAGALAWLAGLILAALTVAIAVLSVRTLHSLFTHRLLAG